MLVIPTFKRLSYAKVSSLKVMGEPRRDEDRLKELFTDRDVGRIKSILLSAREELGGSMDVVS